MRSSPWEQNPSWVAVSAEAFVSFTRGFNGLVLAIPRPSPERSLDTGPLSVMGEAKPKGRGWNDIEGEGPPLFNVTPGPLAR